MFTYQQKNFLNLHQDANPQNHENKQNSKANNNDQHRTSDD